MKFINKYLNEVGDIAKEINPEIILKIILKIKKVNDHKGRIFFLGMGGSAGNASHAVNDFRKLCNIECYTPTDNISEFSARVNDEGIKNTFRDWLEVSKLNKNDLLFIFSVGGGDLKRKISINLINAINFGKSVRASIVSILGRRGGYAEKKSDISLIVPIKNKKNMTPHSESFQVILWHLIISHPLLKINKTKW